MSSEYLGGPSNTLLRGQSTMLMFRLDEKTFVQHVNGTWYEAYALFDGYYATYQTTCGKSIGSYDVVASVKVKKAKPEVERTSLERVFDRIKEEGFKIPDSFNFNPMEVPKHVTEPGVCPACKSDVFVDTRQRGDLILGGPIQYANVGWYCSFPKCGLKFKTKPGK